MNYKVEKFILNLKKFELSLRENNIFIDKYLSEKEKKNRINVKVNPIKELNYYAKIYSGKKSFKKIFNLENFDYKNIYVDQQKDGKPFFNFVDKNLFFKNHNLKDDFRIFLSFSHEDDFLVAFLLKEFKIHI